MIWESHPWRDELCTVADRLEQWSRRLDWDDERVAFEIERDVMVSAYAIRKLAEARKLADSTAATRLEVDAFPLIERVPDLMSWHRLDEFYDFANQRSVSLTMLDLCNQIIHSFVFAREAGVGDDDQSRSRGLAGILVASDRARTGQLYRIDVNSLIRLLRLVGNEEVVGSRMVRDAAGQWQVSNLTADEMEKAHPGWSDTTQSSADRTQHP